MKKIIPIIVVGGIILLGLIQLLPLWRGHVNPAVVSEPNWSSSAARTLVKEHCFECHSNETDWPWYCNVAPASWLIQFDVISGRGKFNFSDWKNNPGELDEIVGAINEGEMPPIQYWIFHPNSRLNSQQKQDLINAIESSVR